MTTVRRDAPWCPSNLEFIRRINDLANIDEAHKTVFDARYLVMGLGDVYRRAGRDTARSASSSGDHKYNPARTDGGKLGGYWRGLPLRLWHGGPGGYQFVGRTLQMWESLSRRGGIWRQAPLLRFFDQIRFYPVSAEELLTIRRDFLRGRYPLRIEHTTLKLAEYQQFSPTMRRRLRRSARISRGPRLTPSVSAGPPNGQAHFDSSEVLGNGWRRRAAGTRTGRD